MAAEVGRQILASSAASAWRPGAAAKRAAIILALFALTALYFNDVLSGRQLLVERDLTTFFYPFRFVWLETVRHGHFPFWNPYIKCGVPLFATIQPAVLYPLSLPYLFLPLDLAFNWTIIFHFFLAAVFTWLLMTEVGATTLGALAAALAFLFSGYLISVHNVLNTLVSVSWYPLVMLCGCRLVRRGQLRWAAATGISLCCMFLGGGVEIVFYALGSLLMLCLYPGLLPVEPLEKSVSLPRRLGLLGLAFAIFLGLSMVQLLPFLELYRYSDRYGGVSLVEATRWSLAPRDFVNFLIPDFYGPHATPALYWKLQNYLKSIYLGPVVLALAAFYFGSRGRRALPLLAAMVLALGFALGGYTPLYAFFYRHVPLFATLRYPVKFIFLFVFYLCLCAGLGLEELGQRFSRSRPPSSRTNAALVSMVLFLAGLLLTGLFFPKRLLQLAPRLGVSSLDPAFLPVVLHNFNRLLLVTILALMILFFGLRRRLVHLGAPLLLFLLGLDLFLGNRGFVTRLDSGSFHAETRIIRTLEADDGLFRFHVLPAVRRLSVGVRSYRDFHLVRKEFLGNDLMMEHHLFDIDGYNVPLQPGYERFINLVRGKPLAAVRNLLDLLNVRYVLAAGPIDQPGYVWIEDGLATSKLYQNRNCLPRAFLVPGFEVVQDGRKLLRRLKDPGFDPRKRVLLSKSPEHYLALRKSRPLPGVKPQVRLIAYENNRMVLKASCPEAAFLFMSEAYYPGWRAYVDGRREEILRADYSFRAVALGPGSHRVELRCQPLSFRLGLAATGATMVLLAAGGAISTTRRKRRR